MNARRLRQMVPTQESLQQYRWFRWFAPWLGHASLWHFNRRSVARAVAVGMLCGLIPGPLQMLGAAMLACAWRVNLPVSLFLTLYSNPLTIVPLYAVAYGLGQLIVGGQGSMQPPPEMADLHWLDWGGRLLDWLLSLGMPLLIGLPALAISLAIAGYVVVDSTWRWRTRAAWQARRRNRQ
ncbi:DUF2062 domain-containing protein [Parachitinimonas caeni]|uniref:DUF2062 domain-containing protein n=1 Tax=Parachitinimonas caeni TaxID=3031301 RepID=A0ABT7DTZ7_9NEIS|nr:DUF2062 domain-containing protein [Parachitinimonas caeni]MDK2123541.1 DUF2062 domain-containing protein [Parachitinimonas caeni]